MGAVIKYLTPIGALLFSKRIREGEIFKLELDQNTSKQYFVREEAFNSETNVGVLEIWEIANSPVIKVKYYDNHQKM